MDVAYDTVPPAIREVLDRRMLARAARLDPVTAGAIDLALTATGGPMLRARVRPRSRRKGRAARVDTRTLAVDVMLPTGGGHWETWFTVRLRGPYVRDLLAMMTAPVPDTPEGLAGPQNGTQDR